MRRTEVLFLLLLVFLAIFMLYNGVGGKIFFLLIFLLCINYGKKERIFFNPFYLFSFTSLTLLIYSSSLNIFFLPELNSYTSFLIILSLFTFIIGLKISKNIHITKKHFYNINLNIYGKGFYWFTIFGGLIPYAMGIMRVGGLPILSYDPNTVRSEFLPPGFSYLTSLLPLSLLIAYSINNKRLIRISTLLLFLSPIILISKSNLTLNLMFLLYAAYRYGNKTKVKQIIYFSFALILILLSFKLSQVIRSGENTTDKKFYLETTKIQDNILGLISFPYYYMTTPWANFQENINIDEYNLGRYSFYPFISALQLDNVIKNITHKKIYQYPFNTFAFPTDFYMDFGLFGIIFLPFILGYYVYSIYWNAINSEDPIKNAEYILVAKATFLMFFSNHFTSVGYPVIGVLIYELLYRFNKTSILK